MRCPACTAENPEVARFCMACGAELSAPVAEEVRQVTILFADLVGFTQRSDNADPEDVRRVLVPFHRAAKAAIEAHGGTLDKFIGDAAMGVFGAPIAHDDDPARAVAAGLDLLGQVEAIRADVDPDASIRVAVETGDAVVAFGAGPQVGEAIAGDVVNTASRMQSLAPPGRLVVGDRAWQAVRDRFDGEAMPPVAVKGKADPIRCHLITGPRVSAVDTVPLVGRDAELARLHAALDAARRGHPSAVTVIAAPGLGKTRLVSAFLERTRPTTVAYQIGFTPFGDDSAFGPFADLVADIAGVPRHAEAAELDAAIDRLLELRHISPHDGGGVRRRLRAILGAGGSTGTPEAPRDMADSIAAALPAAPEGGCTVLVIEDIHWAGPAARAVLAHLVPALGDAPALLVCTARPEAHAADDGVVGETWDLAPLDTRATRAVLAAAAGERLTDDDLERFATRAEGNPLFAIEFGRTVGTTAAGAELPTSVRAVIAARLDALPAPQRDLLADAAVVGATFWPGALAAIDPGRDAQAIIAELVRRGVVTAMPSSRLASEPAYGFTHALIRDEAYGRLPRAARARRHLEVGRWLEAAAGETASSFAAALAHHYGEAVSAGRASGSDDVAQAAEPCAIEWLVTAAEQVFRLDGPGAFAMYERALELGASGDLAERALYGSAVVGRRIGGLPAPEVLDRYRRALASARERGDTQAEGLQLVRMGSQLGAMGASQEALGCFEEAMALLEPLPPGMPLAAALTYRAEEEMFTGHSEASLALVERALPIAREADAHDIVIMGLHLRGDARCELGDLGGLDDLEDALRIARESSGIAETVTSLTYVGEWRWQLEGPRAGAEIFEEGVRLTGRAGIASQGMWARTHLLMASIELGAWDRALELADELLALGADMLDASLDVLARAHRSMVMLRRGELASVDDPAKVVSLAEGSHELQALAPALSFAAQHAVETGDTAAARLAIERLAALTADTDLVYRAGEASTVTRLAIALEDIDLAVGFVEPLGDLHVLRHRLYADAGRAAIAEAQGDPRAADAYRDVADRWRIYAHPWEEAHALLGLGRTTGDTPATARAAELFAGLGVDAP